MGMIIGKKLTQLMKGYPTVSDKYDVLPAVLEGDAEVYFGDPVQLGDTNGYYKAVGANVDPTKIVGFALATNVKLVNEYPGKTVSIKPGEGFNLCDGGYMAVELADDADLDQCVLGSKVHIVKASGKLTSPNKAADDTIVALEGITFTGVTETVGNTKLAEIRIK